MATVLPYHGVTYRQNPAFYSRPYYLEQMSAKLEPDTPQGLKSFALVGFGGCGKTQLAIEYAHTTSSYDAILWNLAKEFTRFQVSVAPFSPLDAQRFLLQYRANNTKNTSQENDATTTISQRLGNLPLALDLVRHHVSASGSSYKEFLEGYGEPSEPFLFDKFSSTWKNEWYHQNILATYTLRIRKMSKAAVEMLHVLAILDASCIPLSIFRPDEENMLYNGPDVEDEVPELQDWLKSPVENTYELDTVVSELMDGSLVDRTVGSGSLSLHRILQDSVAYSFDTSTRSRSFNRVLYFLNGRFPVQQDGGRLFDWWCQCEEYVPHIVSAVRFYKKHHQYLSPPIMLAEVIRRCAWYLWEKHQFEEGKSLVGDAVAICKEALKFGTSLGFTQEIYIPRLLSDLYNVMGALEYESNTNGHGLKWALKARSIRQELCLTLRLEDDEFMLQVVQNNIATDMLANGQPQEALPLLEAIHEYDISTGGINPDNFYRTLNLSICYQLLGSARFYRGNLLLYMGDRVGAFETFSRCFLTRQKLMPTHYDTAFAAHKLGAMAAENGDINASIQFLTQALQIFGNTDPLSLAAARTAFLLSTGLLHSNQNHAAGLLRDKVNQALEVAGKLAYAEAASYSQKFFDSFVLFRHL
ncbi:hypothetical protein FAVG1_07636 [Fusarium avenaceum]|nr:hypothetical protein FAVG1_07636 [Fusarium avenaceum]